MFLILGGNNSQGCSEWLLLTHLGVMCSNKTNTSAVSEHGIHRFEPNTLVYLANMGFALVQMEIKTHAQIYRGKNPSLIRKLGG